jgi:hypothetical protein
MNNLPIRNKEKGEIGLFFLKKRKNLYRLMILQTKLNQIPCGYRHSREFIADCHLIFQNAMTYVDPKVSESKQK